jgi:EAL domain-containing protein (putative c-di-GMP-specific phosphodiesterase class I)
LRRAGKPLTVSINLSARNLHDSQLPGKLAELMRTRGGSPERLELEITESAIMADPVRAMDILSQVHGTGIRFSIDDFGTGYSSLAYLKKLPVDAIKIDKAFVINMAKDPNDAVIVRSTIELGHNMGIKVVAEGVENQETYQRLIELGCDAAQGYYMGRPLPFADLNQWLDESPWGLKKA